MDMCPLTLRPRGPFGIESEVKEAPPVGDVFTEQIQ